jgi:energy-coupling factor transport system permease protein
VPDQFSLYLNRPSRLHALHPVTKLVLALCLLAAALLLPGLWTTYVIFLLVIVPLAALGQVLGPLLRAVWPIVLPFALSVFIIQGFLWPGGTSLIGLGWISLKREGLLFAIAAAGRILVVVSSFVLFALTTRPDTLMLSLVQRGVPGGLAYIIVATIQLVPRFRARAAAIMDAQRARGLETTGSLRRRLSAIVPLVVPLILSSLVDVEERALAIEARAFNHPGPKTSLIEITEAGWERPARWLLLLLVPLFLALRLWPR